MNETELYDKRVEREETECAGRYCSVLFKPRKADQQYCSRRCSFLALRYSRHNSLWQEISDDRGYRHGRGAGDDDGEPGF